jgi:hypothetical protein
MTHLIDKDRIVAEIKERINRDNEKAASYSDGSEFDYFYRLKESLYKDLLSFINTLEVKEVDLEKEIKLYKMRNPIIGHREESLYNYMSNVAKHFFGLGLKVDKGE